MTIGLLGKKLGMSRIFSNKGIFTPVTLISFPFNFIYKINFSFNHYKYFKISYIFKKKLKFNFNNKYLIFNKYFFLKQFNISDFDFLFFILNQTVSLNIFYINQNVNITAFSIGKGFAGVIKKYNFSSGTASHGNSKSHRSCGSTGMSQDPGRVFLGKKMPGHLGCKKKTIQNLKIIKIDFYFNVIYIKGNLPGYIGSYLIINSKKKI